jgi:hypothetical protein
VNCNRLSLFATSRTPRKPRNASFHLCVWDPVVCSVCSLTDRLPSMPSSSGFPPLFEHFVGVGWLHWNDSQRVFIQQRFESRVQKDSQTRDAAALGVVRTNDASSQEVDM